MKRLFFMAAAIVVTCLSSCKYDDGEIWDSFHGLEDRVAKLEELCKQMNTNISSLQTIVTALQQNDYVTGVAPVTSNGETIGYTISFTKSAPITIYHGQNGKDGHTPIIGVRQDADGIYYWTLDGDWLLDSSSNKIKAEGRDGQNGSDGKDGKDGITPQLRIEEGYWYVSTDNGTTWTNLGKATGEDGENGTDGKDGDSFFKNVDTSDNEYVLFTLADGTEIKLPRVNATENIKFEDSMVKALCIANWDTNYDGEFSYAEAAAVTALGEVFRGTKIRSFNELAYFTGLTAIDDYAFENCSELCCVAYPASVTTIGKYAFNRTGLINIIIPETIKVIDDCAFNECGQVQRIDLRHPVTLHKQVFAFTTGKVYLNCNLPDYTYLEGTFRWSNISKLVVGDDVEIIGDYAFTECNYLSDIEFASKGKLHTIGIGNFFRSAITTFDIPRSLQVLGESAFVECSSLETITGYSKNIQVQYNVLMYITGRDNKIILYPPARNDETYTIPEVIKIIGNSAFRQCHNLKTVVFPEHSYSGYEVSEIGEMAFYDCKNLVSVPNFEKTLITDIPRVAFSGCKSLESIDLPPTVETIGEGAFYGCSSLTNITIPSGVTEIGDEAFRGCDNLTTIYCKAQIPPAIQYQHGSSSDHWEQYTLYVPVGCKEAYAAAEYWKDVKEIIEMEF